ncbi:MAG: cob(I)yrinic acid a,c-diamide adenosyltransferase [Deltaproteobacteria bacterium]|nr:cob(I)yrinic acid a,c-diamide adenosyltransferase [Deltaproteobacteria bacterium]
MSIATKTGDQGKTRFFSGETVTKSHPRLETYGTLDEVISALGLARSLCQVTAVRDEVHTTQRELFQLGAELATPNPAAAPFQIAPLTATHLARLDQLVLHYEATIRLPRAFIVPGGTPSAAALDVARTVCRRFERLLVRMAEAGEFQNHDALKYINRLSDVCFLWARAEEAAAGVAYESVSGRAP